MNFPNLSALVWCVVTVDLGEIRLRRCLQAQSDVDAIYRVGRSLRGVAAEQMTATVLPEEPPEAWQQWAII